MKDLFAGSAIRQKRAKGKKLEKWEEEFLHEHRSLVILENKTSEEEQKRIAAEEAAVDALFKGCTDRWRTEP